MSVLKISVNSQNMSGTEEQGPEDFKPKKWPQLLAGGIATNGAFVLGAVLAWPAPSIPEIIKSKELGDVSGSQSSWIASLALLGAAVSAIPTAYMMESIGRRRTMMAFSIPLFCSWMIVAFSDSVRMLCLGRFLTGLCSGAYSIAVPPYLREIASEKFRSHMVSLFTTQVAHGVLFVYIHAIFVDWVSLSLASSMSAIVVLIGMYFMPESPIYLLNKGKDVEAGNALKWLRRAQNLEQIEPELTIMQSNVKDQERSGEVNLLKLGRSAWKPLGICAAFMVFQGWSGLLVVISFTSEIFQTMGSPLSPNVSSIIFGVVQVIGVSLAGLLIDRLGRRILLIGSSVLVLLCWVSLGIALKLQEENQGVMPEEIQILPLICLLGFSAVFSLGLGPITWILPSELLPANARDRLGAVAVTFNWLAAFLLVKIYYGLSESIGVYSCYWIFAGVSLSAALFTYFVLPETKGKSQEEIRNYFGAGPNFSKSSTNM